MAVPELNDDVLIIICDFLTAVPDVRAVSLTCSSFRMVAIRRLFSMRPIHLTDSASIRRFHAFFFADAAARAPWVRAFDIKPEAGSSPSDDVSPLIDIVTSCQQLQEISLRRRSSSLLTEYPRLIDAIASIESLRALSFQSSALDLLTLVRRIRTPLRTLTLSCWLANESEHRRGSFIWYPVVFQESLLHLAPTLEELRLHELLVDPEDIRELSLDLEDIQEPHEYNLTLEARYLPVSCWMQYPAVRSLSVNVSPRRLLLGPLQHLFPALDGTLTLGDDFRDLDEVELAGIRAANYFVQETPNDNSNSCRRGWKKLDRLVCSVVTFYLLCLRCPVGLVILGTVSEQYDCELVQYCATVALHENPVPRLSLILDCQLHPFDSELFSRKLGATLTHLTLAVDGVRPWRASIPFGWYELLDLLVASLRYLASLTHFRIVLYSQGPEDTDTDTDTDGTDTDDTDIDTDTNTEAPSHAHPTQRTTSERLARALHPSVFNFAWTAAEVVRMLPSLQFLFVTTCGHFTNRENAGRTTDSDQMLTGKRWSISRAWRVAEPSIAVDGAQVRERGQLALVELQDGITEAIIEREELVLPDACKTWFS